MVNMENAEEVMQILDRFTRLKQKDIPKELDDYLQYVAKTGDTVFKWSNLKYLFREKLLNVVKHFHDTSTRMDDIPQYPNVDPFNYENMKSSLLERLELFNAAPFTIQRLCELLIEPRKQYSRIDKFMRALEKNILVVSTIEPGRKRNESENGDSLDSMVNGDLSLDVNVDIDMENDSIFNMAPTHSNGSTTSSADVNDKEACGESKEKSAMQIPSSIHMLEDPVQPNAKKAKLDLGADDESDDKKKGETDEKGEKTDAEAEIITADKKLFENEEKKEEKGKKEEKDDDEHEKEQMEKEKSKEETEPVKQTKEETTTANLVKEENIDAQKNKSLDKDEIAHDWEKTEKNVQATAPEKEEETKAKDELLRARKEKDIIEKDEFEDSEKGQSKKVLEKQKEKDSNKQDNTEDLELRNENSTKTANKQITTECKTKDVAVDVDGGNLSTLEKVDTASDDSSELDTNKLTDADAAATESQTTKIEETDTTKTEEKPATLSSASKAIVEEIEITPEARSEKDTEAKDVATKEIEDSKEVATPTKIDLPVESFKETESNADPIHIPNSKTPAEVDVAITLPTLTVNDQMMDDAPLEEGPPTVEEVTMSETTGATEMATDTVETTKTDEGGMEVDDCSQEAMDQ